MPGFLLPRRDLRFVRFGEEGFQVEAAVAILHALQGDVVRHALPFGPFAGVTVPGQLDAVEVGVVQIEGDMGAVVVVAVDVPAVVEQPLVSHREVAAGRVVDGEMVEPGGAAGGG